MSDKTGKGARTGEAGRTPAQRAPEATEGATREAGAPAAGRTEAGRGPSRQRTSRGGATVLLAMGDSWGSVLAVGCVSVVLGIMVLAWPDVTLGILAVLLGIQILVYGVFCVAQAIAAQDIDGGRRVLVAVLGVVAIIAGILVLRSITHTLVILASLLGLFWVIAGVVGIVSAFMGKAEPGRGLAVVSGVLSVVAGIIVLAYPTASLTVLVVVLGIWLVVFGALTIGIAAQMRSARNGTRGKRNRGAAVTT
ncbi:MAG TPA: HdeD family acid-resistance protein [Actinopolymorphaceae bacterium]|jgi:uncharacterized membrane protein HdeD (DUF308 family)|nr:HdeD family acid-resistance protein [Actinopolymorphaceae bacterium]